MTRPTSLATVLLHLLARSAGASAQDGPRDARLYRLPISVSLPVFVAWAEGARTMGVTSGVSLSTHISAPLALGISFRGWSGQVSDQSCSLTGDCTWQQQTLALSLLAHTEVYPLQGRLVFFRGAAGISWLREQEAQGSVIHESRVWPFTVCGAVGWDAHVTNHVFATPLLELLATTRGRVAPRTSPRWFVQAGVGLTVR
jgi:hypothetical protein